MKRMCLLVVAMGLAAGPSSAQDTHSVELNEDGTVNLNSATLGGAGLSDAAGNWFAITNAAGGVETYLFAPEGQAVPANVLNGLQPGQAIVRAEAPEFFGLQPPSPEQVRGIIEGMLSNARQAVCDLGSGRPARFGTAVDVSAGIGISGTIQFSAEWETDQLCEGL